MTNHDRLGVLILVDKRIYLTQACVNMGLNLLNKRRWLCLNQRLFSYPIFFDPAETLSTTSTSHNPLFINRLLTSSLEMVVRVGIKPTTQSSRSLHHDFR